MKYTPDSPSQLSLSIVAAVNDEDVLQRNLLKSPILQSGHIKLFTYRNQPSASCAYNRGLRETDSDYVAFVHQDVYLPTSWEKNLRSALASLDRTDSDWAVLGVIGLSDAGAVVGRVWSSGLARALGKAPPAPVRVVSIDELGFVVRRAAGCSFDEHLPGFHLYGTDILQIAADKGRHSYVADLPVIHNSRPVTTLGGGYAESYKYMQSKWRKKLPLRTLIVPICSNPFQLYRARMRVFYYRRQLLSNSLSNKTNPIRISEKQGYE